ncbi:FAD-dependent oxidoreductase [Streptomyces sp. NPDC059985]|uniref:FAD-dependent oxidoreductase n=1 Tax=Streptomyces sp. NPDC059985 TaxID=3347025 RepID=UPI0036820A24
MPWSTRCAAAARPMGPAPMTTTGSSVLAGAFTVDSSVFRHLSMACSASMAPDSMSVNIDIRRIGRSLMEHADVAVVGAGQAGLATAYALVGHGLKPVVLEASDQPAGSWPRYCDSLTLCSPARFGSLPGMPFGGGDPDRYPHRDEVVAYLTTCAARRREGGGRRHRVGHRVSPRPAVSHRPRHR